MFGAYSERMDGRAKRQMAASLVVSIVLYGGGITAVALAADAVAPTKKKDKEVEVTFYKAVPKPPPPAPEPPPPPPPPEPPPPAPEPPPPPKPPPPKVRKGRKPPPKAPKKMPEKPAAEAEPTDEPKPEPETLDGDLPNQWGDPDGESADVGKTYGAVDGKEDGTGPIDQPPPPPKPVILPAGATRPSVIGSLVSESDYPRAALAARVEGTVIVKVAVQVDGTVKLVKFLKRDPNFDEAVLSILKRLRFKPAVYNGKPIAVYQNLKFPFTLQ